MWWSNKTKSSKEIIIAGELDSNLANDIQSVLINYDLEDNTPIRMVINSNGGSVYPALGIIDTMSIVSCIIETECVSVAAGAAALILAMGSKGHRYAHKSSRIALMFAKGSRSDSLSLPVDTLTLNCEIFSLFARQTGIPRSKIESAVEKAGGTLWMTAEEAKSLGFIDEIINSD